MVDVAHDRHHGGAGMQLMRGLMRLRLLGKKGIGLVQPGRLGYVPMSSTTIMAVSWSST